MTNNVGWKATFNFFRVLVKLKLLEKKRISKDFWLDIRDMLVVRKWP
jgi:hypothetical protein